jgi:hypothetical protein
MKVTGRMIWRSDISAEWLNRALLSFGSITPPVRKLTWQFKKERLAARAIHLIARR